MEINENEIYTAEEIYTLLKISKSTFLRLVKNRKLAASKVGGQYRILGKEVLEMFDLSRIDLVEEGT